MSLEDVLVNRTLKAQSSLLPGRIASTEERARLIGKVTGPDGHPIQGARLWMQHSRHEGVSREDGKFEIPGIPTGWIDLVVEHEQFKPLILNDIKASDGLVNLGIIMFTSNQE